MKIGDLVLCSRIEGTFTVVHKHRGGTVTVYGNSGLYMGRYARLLAADFTVLTFPNIERAFELDASRNGN